MKVPSSGRRIAGLLLLLGVGCGEPGGDVEGEVDAGADAEADVAVVTDAEPPMDAEPPVDAQLEVDAEPWRYTYAANAANWRDGELTVDAEVAVEGRVATFTGGGSDPSAGGVIASCTWSFGDRAPPLRSAALDGVCPAVEHVYEAEGPYHAMLTLRDELGAIGQKGLSFVVGPELMVSGRQQALIGDALEAYYWHPTTGGPFPTIVRYTPYQVTGTRAPALAGYVPAGYAYVAVTTRGQGSSLGDADLFGLEARDDVGLIDAWLQGQAWSTGAYCLHGHSGPGIMGSGAVSERPPNLKCAILGGGDTQLDHGLITKSGARWPIVTHWLLATYREAILHDPAGRMATVADYLVAAHEDTLDNTLFSERDWTDALAASDVPVLFETSWDDLAWGGGPGGGPYLDLVTRMGNPYSALLVYAGPHPSFDPTGVRPFRTYPEHETLHVREMRAFFDHFLKGGPAPDTDDYDIRYLTLRGGAQAAYMNGHTSGWGTSSAWPPESASPVDLHLRAGPTGTTHSVFDGALLAAPPEGEESPAATPYRPAQVWDPVYSSGAAPWRAYGFPDLRGVERDGLTFTSAPLLRDVELTGPVVVELFAESALYDWDFMVLLTEVWPDGSSHRISSGFARASHRNGLDVFEPAPSGVQRYEIQLASISNVFPRGHRIRVSVLTANSTDATAETIQLRLSPSQPSKVTFSAVGGELPLGADPVCEGCDPEAVAEERFDGLMQRYITFGFQGADPASETVYRAAGKVVYRRAGAQARGSVILAGGGVSQGCGVVGIEAAERADFRIELDCAPNTLWLDCQQRDDPGALWFTTSQRDIGPLEHVAGSVRCHDVPYVNW